MGRAEGGGSGFRAAQAWGLGACRGVRGGCVRAVACVGVRVRAGEGSPRSDC